MTATPDQAAQSWRGLGDQLTSEQIAELTQMERLDSTGTLLRGAREFTEWNLASSVMFGDVTPPADATRFYSVEDDGDGAWARNFTGTERTVDDATITVCGIQYQDGRTERVVDIECRDGHGLAAARQIAAAIIEAADEITHLEEREQS